MLLYIRQNKTIAINNSVIENKDMWLNPLNNSFLFFGNWIFATKKDCKQKISNIVEQDVYLEIRYLQLLFEIYLYHILPGLLVTIFSLLLFWLQLIRLVILTSSTKLNVKRRKMFLPFSLSARQYFIKIDHYSAGSVPVSTVQFCGSVDTPILYFWP